MPFIQNQTDLATTPLREDALALVEAGLAAIATDAVIAAQVSLAGETLTVAGTDYHLADYDRLFVAGVGKCAFDAAVALEALLGDRISAGLVLDVRMEPGKLQRIEARKGSHPFPSEANVVATEKLIALFEEAGDRDLILFVVSGGGSTLLCAPKRHRVEEERALLAALFHEGASIHDINTVRKHLSLARGGHLARAAHPTQLISLIFSDVPGNNLSTIASGPTVPDETTLEDARGVLAAYDIAAQAFNPEALMETPKEQRYFKEVRNVLALTGETALAAMAKEARGRGYMARLCESALEGEARGVAEDIAAELHSAPPMSVLLFGGETTVEVAGQRGEGGRNQELALSALGSLAEGELILPFASDGHDNSSVAGAIADAQSAARAKELALDREEYLLHHNSLEFFRAVGAALITGYTGSNVADIIIAMKKK